MAYLRKQIPLLAERFVQSGDHCLTILAHEDQENLLQGIDPAQISWVSDVRPGRYRRIWWERRTLPRIVRKKEIDVLFTPYQIAPKVPGIRHVVMIRNMEPFLFDDYPYSLGTWLRNRLLRRASACCLRGADRVIAVSDFAYRHVTRRLGIDAEHVRRIYHGRSDLCSSVDAAEERGMLKKIGVDDDYILTCGSLLPYRRCEDVIAAFNQCAPDFDAKMSLVIAGSGTDRLYGALIRKTIASSPFRERILTVGHVSWETMAALFRRSVACVIASEIEACPNIAIEAMSAGCTIISSDLQPLPEIFQDCSLEYRAREIGSLAHQMRRAIEDGDLRHEMKARALKRAEDFSWEKCASETYAALTQWS